jgi:hypothetical protein
LPTRANEIEGRLLEAVNLVGKATSAPLDLVRMLAPAAERLVVELERNIRVLDEYMDEFDKCVSAADNSNADIEFHLGELEESEEKLRRSQDALTPSIMEAIQSRRGPSV